jgi:hypothetical protein
MRKIYSRFDIMGDVCYEVQRGCLLSSGKAPLVPF